MYDTNYRMIMIWLSYHRWSDINLCRLPTHKTLAVIAPTSIFGMVINSWFDYPITDQNYTK